MPGACAVGAVFGVVSVASIAGSAALLREATIFLSAQPLLPTAPHRRGESSLNSVRLRRDQIELQLYCFPLLDNLCRNAYRNCVVRQIFSHNCAGSNNGSFPNTDAI